MNNTETTSDFVDKPTCIRVDTRARVHSVELFESVLFQLSRKIFTSPTWYFLHCCTTGIAREVILSSIRERNDVPELPP